MAKAPVCSEPICGITRVCHFAIAIWADRGKKLVQNASGEDICRILSAFGIDNADRIYTKGGLAALKSNVKAF